MRTNSRWKRIGTQFAFWILLIALIGSVLINFVNLGNPSQLSAYDDDWDDLSAFRQDLVDMGIETRSLVSSPLLLEELEDPANTTFVISGVERDTISLPQFNLESVIQFSTEDGYSPNEIAAMRDFVIAGGTLIVFEDFGYASSIAEAFGVSFKGARLYDTVYVEELDYNYIWACMQTNPCGMNESILDPATLSTHSRWNSTDILQKHICSLWGDLNAVNPNISSISLEKSGLCKQHWNAGVIEYNASYQMLLSSPTAIDVVVDSSVGLFDPYIRAVSSSEATVDLNDDGEIWVGGKIDADTPDISGQFNLSIEVCPAAPGIPSCGLGLGRAHFVADGSLLINAMYDYEGFNAGEYGEIPTKKMPANDNRKWALDVIAEALMEIDPEVGPTGQPSENAMVIFDESRHVQSYVATDSYNMLYFFLVYFTGDGLAKLILFVGIFVLFEMVLLRKKDPEPWRHVFSIIYYGFGDANRYSYYAKPNKIKQVFLSKVRNQNGMTREEFDAMPARDLQKMIADPILIQFVFENKPYSLEQSVAIVKRIKAWGRT